MTPRRPRIHPDEAIFYAIVPQADRRREERQAAGIRGTIGRVIGGVETHRFDVLVTDRSERGLGLRSPVPLQQGALYRITTPTTGIIDVHVIRSRGREDGAYDVAALHADVAARRVRTAA